MTRIIIPGKLPGWNEYSNKERSSKYAAAETKRDIENRIVDCVLQCADRAVYDGPVVISFRWAEPDKRRDKDNIASAKKFIIDALQKAGTLKGDGWKHIEGFEDWFSVNADEPHVRVDIYTLAEWLA